MFLGHTHIPTKWDKQNIEIVNRDWARRGDGSLGSEWVFPDKVACGADVRLVDGEVRMNLWVRNGSRAPLTAMRSQVCVLLARAPEFAHAGTYSQPRASVTSRDGRRRILTEWDDCQRVWGNERCPCLHSDPRLPDCAPGETVRQQGRIWFEGA